MRLMVGFFLENWPCVVMVAVGVVAAAAGCVQQRQDSLGNRSIWVCATVVVVADVLCISISQRARLGTGRLSRRTQAAAPTLRHHNRGHLDCCCDVLST